MTESPSSLLKSLPFWHALTAIFIPFSLFYCFVAWLVSGGDVWWVIDFVNGTNVFYGDDAYRFFLAQFAWRDPALYSYNFVLPAALVLDGVVVTLADGDIFWARCIRGVLSSLALCLIWSSGLQLQVNAIIMAAAVVIMGLFPRYAFTSLSFYGESWLGICLCLVLWLYLRQCFMAMAIVAGILPLLRPEGIYFLAPLCFFLVIKRQWKEAILMILPGFFYATFLLASLEYLQDYSYWRYELRRILTKLVLNQSHWEIVDTYSWLLLLPAMGGMLYAPARRLWPFVFGGLVWAVVLQVLVLTGLSSYEERYMHGVLPTLILLWACFFAWAWEKSALLMSRRALRTTFICVFSFLLVKQHVMQMTLLEHRVRQEGAWSVASSLLKGEWAKVFSWHEPIAQVARERMAGEIVRLLAEDSGIDRLVVFDPFLYYKLDASAIPDRVTISYPAATYMTFHLLLNGQVFVHHQRGRMYTYLRFGQPDYRSLERRVLYVDLMPLSGYPFTWRFEGLQYELYLFSYLSSLESEVDLDDAPSILPEDLRRANMEMIKRRGGG